MIKMRFALLAVLVFGLFTNTFAQKARPLNLLENLKLIETVDLKQSEFHHAGFTETGELFLVLKNRNTKKVWYRIGSKRHFFAPCKNSEYQTGRLNVKEDIFVLSCADFSVEIWRLGEPIQLAGFKVPKDKKSRSLFPYLSPNGKRIVFKPSLFSDEAELRSALTGERIGTLDSYRILCDRCNRIAYTQEFSPDSKKLAVSYGGIVIIWDAETGERISWLKDENVRLYSSDALSHKGAATQIRFSSDSKTVVTGSYYGDVKSWDVETGKLKTIFTRHKDRVYALAISPDDSTIAAGSRDGRVIFSDLKSGRLLAKSKKRGEVQQIGFSPDGNHIYKTTRSRTLFLSAKTGRLVARIKKYGFGEARVSKNWDRIMVLNSKKKRLEVYGFRPELY